MEKPNGQGVSENIFTGVGSSTWMGFGKEQSTEYLTISEGSNSSLIGNVGSEPSENSWLPTSTEKSRQSSGEKLAYGYATPKMTQEEISMWLNELGSMLT